jgi:hypothetical protein
VPGSGYGFCLCLEELDDPRCEDCISGTKTVLLQDSPQLLAAVVPGVRGERVESLWIVLPRNLSLTVENKGPNARHWGPRGQSL